MRKISEFLGKPLISLADAACIGFVSNVWFDCKLKKAKLVEVVNDEGEPERVFLPFDKIVADADAAVLKSGNGGLPEPTATAVPCPINRPCFNISGEALGTLTDVTLDGAAVLELVCGDKTFTPNELLTVGKTLCILNDTGKPYKLPAKKHASSRTPRKPATPPAKTPT